MPAPVVSLHVQLKVLQDLLLSVLRLDNSARKEWENFFGVMNDWYSFEAHIFMTSCHFQKLQIHDGDTSNHTLLKMRLLKPYIFYVSEKPEVMLVYSCPKLVKPSILCIFSCPRGQVPQPWLWQSGTPLDLKKLGKLPENQMLSSCKDLQK